MLEQDLGELTEYDFGRRGSGARKRKGWSLVEPVWDAKGKRLLGCLRVESFGDSDGLDMVTEFEESHTAV